MYYYPAINVSSRCKTFGVKFNHKTQTWLGNLKTAIILLFLAAHFKNCQRLLQPLFSYNCRHRAGFSLLFCVNLASCERREVEMYASVRHEIVNTSIPRSFQTMLLITSLVKACHTYAVLIYFLKDAFLAAK